MPASIFSHLLVVKRRLVTLIRKMVKAIVLVIYRDALVTELVDLSEITGVSDYVLIEQPKRLTFDEPHSELLSRVINDRGGPIYHEPIFRKSIYSYVVRDVKLCSTDGVVCTDDDRIIVDSLLERWRFRLSHAYKAYKTSRPLLRGCYTSIWSSTANNYHDWLVECLPRLYSIKLAAREPITLLAPDNASTLQRQTLEYCLPETVRIEYRRDDWLRLEKFLVASHLSIERVPYEHLSYVRECIFAALGLPREHVARNNIYISRTKARRRRVINEDQVVQCLLPYGFVPYVLEDMSFDEQVRLFHSANIVVAPHGGGLANVVFSGKINVIEMVPRRAKGYYVFLTQALGQQLFWVGSSDSGMSTVQEFRTDIGVLKKTVERVIKMEPVIETRPLGDSEETKCAPA